MTKTDKPSSSSRPLTGEHHNRKNPYRNRQNFPEAIPLKSFENCFNKLVRVSQTSECQGDYRSGVSGSSLPEGSTLDKLVGIYRDEELEDIEKALIPERRKASSPFPFLGDHLRNCGRDNSNSGREARNDSAQQDLGPRSFHSPSEIFGSSTWDEISLAGDSTLNSLPDIDRWNNQRRTNTPCSILMEAFTGEYFAPDEGDPDQMAMDRAPLERDISRALRRESGLSTFSIETTSSTPEEQYYQNSFGVSPLWAAVSAKDQRQKSYSLRSTLNAPIDFNQNNESFFAVNKPSTGFSLYPLPCNPLSDAITELADEEEEDGWETVKESQVGMAQDNNEQKATGPRHFGGDVQQNLNMSNNAFDFENQPGRLSRIAQHPGHDNYSGSYSQKFIMPAATTPRSKHIPVILPSHTLYKTNGFLSDSSRVPFPRTTFNTSPSLKQTHVNPFKSSPPELPKPKKTKGMFDSLRESLQSYCNYRKPCLRRFELLDDDKTTITTTIAKRSTSIKQHEWAVPHISREDLNNGLSFLNPVRSERDEFEADPIITNGNPITIYYEDGPVTLGQVSTNSTHRLDQAHPTSSVDFFIDGSNEEQKPATVLTNRRYYHTHDGEGATADDPLSDQRFIYRSPLAIPKKTESRALYSPQELHNIENGQAANSTLGVYDVITPLPQVHQASIDGDNMISSASSFRVLYSEPTMYRTINSPACDIGYKKTQTTLSVLLFLSCLILPPFLFPLYASGGFNWLMYRLTQGHVRRCSTKQKRWALIATPVSMVFSFTGVVLAIYFTIKKPGSF